MHTGFRELTTNSVARTYVLCCPASMGVSAINLPLRARPPNHSEHDVPVRTVCTSIPPLVHMYFGCEGEKITIFIVFGNKRDRITRSAAEGRNQLKPVRERNLVASN